jgi:hypothetical protein
MHFASCLTVNTLHFHYEKITAVEIIILFVKGKQKIQLHSMDKIVFEFCTRQSICIHCSLKGKGIDQRSGDEVIKIVTLRHSKFHISLVLKEYCASTVYCT